MALANGGYVLVPESAVGLALDSQGATTTNGANVRLWTRLGSAGELVTVQTYGSHRVIRMTLTGMVLDVQRATMRNGQNIYQHTWNKGLNQQWDMVEAGTATIDGTSYPTYYVRCAQNNGFEMGVAGSSALRANIQLETRAAVADHRWAFVPAPVLQGGGAYRLVSAISSSICAGLSGNSGDSQVRVAGISDTNLQRWLARDMGSGYVRLESLSSRGWYATPKGLAATDSNPVTLQRASSDLSQQWQPIIVGSKSYNGQQFPVVELFNRESPTQALDVKGAKSEVGTVLQTYISNGSAAQKWLAVPETALREDYPAPAEPGVAPSVGGERSSQAWGRGSVLCHPCWLGTSDQWEVRWRSRSRRASAGDTALSSWTAWRTPSGSEALQGWGTGEAPTATTTAAADPSGRARRYMDAMPFEVSPDGADRVEVQYQVRRWGAGADVPEHGIQTNGSFPVLYRPELTASGFEWDPEGLRLLYSSDQMRGGNELTVWRITETSGTTTRVLWSSEDGLPIGGLPWQGSALVPQSRLSRIPLEGSTISAELRWQNVDGAWLHERQEATGALSYGSGRDLSLVPTIVEPAEANGWMLSVSAGVTADTYTAYVAYGSEVERYDSATGEWSIPVRFGEPYSLVVMAQAGGSWGMVSSAHPAVASPGIVLNTSSSCFVVEVNVGGIPLRSQSTQADWDGQTTNAGGWERVHVGEGQSGPGTLQGVRRDTGSIWGDVDLAEAMVGQYAWLREYGNKRRRVVVVGLDRTRKSRAHEQFVLSYRVVDA